MGAMTAFAVIAALTRSYHAYADTDREKILNDRINYLEERLKRVEEALGKTTKPPAHISKIVAKKTEVVQVTSPQIVTAQDLPATQQPAAAQSDTTAVENPQIGVGESQDAPQELNVLRENAVTLKPSGFELSTEFDYLSRESQLQHDRGVTSTTTLRYGVFNWLELSATIPFGYTNRTTDISPAQSINRVVSGFGDLTLQANAKVFEQSRNWPGVVLSLGVLVPTGPDPYDFTNYGFESSVSAATANPRNPLYDYFSLGQWGIHTNVQFYKTVDPIILFFGLGLDRIFPTTQNGYTVDAYTRFNYNFGMSFALSEKTTLGFSVNGSYAPNIRVNGGNIFQTSIEPTVARITVIQRVFKNVWLEPSTGFGLNQDTPDFVLGLGLRARF